jgi:hypothetical protein
MLATTRADVIDPADREEAQLDLDSRNSDYLFVSSPSFIL